MGIQTIPSAVFTSNKHLGCVFSNELTTLCMQVGWSHQFLYMCKDYLLIIPGYSSVDVMIDANLWIMYKSAIWYYSGFLIERARSLKHKGSWRSPLPQLGYLIHIWGVTTCSPQRKTPISCLPIQDPDTGPHGGWLRRAIKESIYIRALKLDLNPDGGRHQLRSIWDVPIKLCDLGAPRSHDPAWRYHRSCAGIQMSGWIAKAPVSKFS